MGIVAVAIKARFGVGQICSEFFGEHPVAQALCGENSFVACDFDPVAVG